MRLIQDVDDVWRYDAEAETIFRQAGEQAPDEMGDAGKSDLISVLICSQLLLQRVSYSMRIDVPVKVPSPPWNNVSPILDRHIHLQRPVEYLLSAGLRRNQ